MTNGPLVKMKARNEELEVGLRELLPLIESAEKHRPRCGAVACSCTGYCIPELPVAVRLLRYLVGEWQKRPIKVDNSYYIITRDSKTDRLKVLKAQGDDPKSLWVEISLDEAENLGVLKN